MAFCTVLRSPLQEVLSPHSVPKDGVDCICTLLKRSLMLGDS